MTTPPIETGEPRAMIDHVGGLGSEVAWWVVIGVMSIIDGVGFYVNMSLLLFEQDPWTLGVVVVGCSFAAVVLPTLFGRAVGRLEAGRPWLYLLGIAVAWLVLGGLMIFVRLTSENISGGAGLGGLDDTSALTENPYASVIIAVLFFVVYLTTGLLAYQHAVKAVGEAPVRRLVGRRARLRRDLARARQALAVDQRMHKLAAATESRLREAEQLELETVEAFENLEYSDARVQAAENIGEPGATETLLRNP